MAVVKGVTVRVNASIGVRVSAGVCAEVDACVGVDKGVDISVGVGVEGGDKSGTIALGTDNVSPAATATTREMVKTLPTVTPTTGRSMDGTLNHKDCRKPMVAAAVSIPRDMLMNFKSPASRREVIPSFLKRLSRLSARVFNSYADPVGISINTCTLPAVIFAIFN